MTTRFHSFIHSRIYKAPLQEIYSEQMLEKTFMDKILLEQ